MQNIREFFKKISNIHAQEIALRGRIQAVVKEKTSIEIPIEDIVIKSGMVTFKHISQAAKSVIFIHKQKIIKEINTLDAASTVRDIR
jgi:hypothetical protein